MAEAPSDAEFLKWLSPGAASQRLPADWPVQTKRDVIMRRIRDGSLVALARSAKIRDDRGTRVVKLSQIDRRVWGDDWVSEDRDFWTAGDIEFWIPRPTDILFHAGLDRQPEDERPPPKAIFKEVRIEPASFARAFAGHLPSEELVPAPASKPESPPTDALTAAEFAGWLSPKSALAAVPGDVDEAQRKAWITRRLREGQIVAAAERMTLTDINGPREASYATIKRHFWRSWRELGDWFASGDLDVTDAPESDSAGKPISRDALTKYRYDDQKHEVSRYSVALFLGVRVDPAGFPAKPAPATIYLPPPPSPEEFEQWWLPCNAIDSFLPLGEDQAKEAVRSFLTAGVIRAAAEKLILDDKVLGLTGIPKEVWPEVRGEKFWSTDFFKIRFGKTSLTAFGVKLDPDAICEHAPARPPPRPPIDKSDLLEALDPPPRPDASAQAALAPPPETKRLSDGRLTEWAKLFFASQPRATEKEARQSLTIMFPNNSVSRARLRAVMPPRQRGRPLKTKEEN